jgi:hypothetical protein
MGLTSRPARMARKRRELHAHLYGQETFIQPLTQPNTQSSLALYEAMDGPQVSYSRGVGVRCAALSRHGQCAQCTRSR